MIELRNVCCTFGYSLFAKNKLTAVSPLSVTFSKGNRYAIVGESGSGKTTLARMIAGLQKPSSGELLLEGKAVYKGQRRMRNHFKSVQLIQQNSLSALDPKMSVGKSIEEPLICFQHLGGKERQKACESLMEKCYLPLSYYKKLPHELSGGEQKRVAIARALAAKPSCLIFDEATNGFDLPLRKKITEEIIQLQKSIGFTSIFITHDMELAMVVADEILVMKESRLVEKVKYTGNHFIFKNEYSKTLVQASDLIL